MHAFSLILPLKNQLNRTEQLFDCCFNVLILVEACMCGFWNCTKMVKTNLTGSTNYCRQKCQYQINDYSNRIPLKKQRSLLLCLNNSFNCFNYKATNKIKLLALDNLSFHSEWQDIKYNKAQIKESESKKNINNTLIIATLITAWI